MHLDATEYNDDIVFLHAVQEGPASQSYGIQVAKLAGIPAEVIALARLELASLEAGAHAAATLKSGGEQPVQRELFTDPVGTALLEALAGLDPDDLSPKQALEQLYMLKQLSK